MDVKDKVAVVTGGAQGIGLALCTRFAQEGAHVVLSDLSQETCERQAAPIGALPVAANVGREEDIANLVSATVDHFGRIDLFVSNAGIAVDGGLDTPNDGWHKIIDVNLMSEIYAARHAIPHMLEQGGGYLLNVASAAGLLVIPDTRLVHGDQAPRSASSSGSR
jgi:NAD(P)-dependent dehydrogenase (short-subunit alcohol dehydrogenase family)